MFTNIGWPEIFVLVAAGLIILGPERLPGAISWTMQSIRKARDYASGATDQLKNDLGTDFDDLRKPLAELNELRGMTPRAVITKHLLDGDDSVLKSFTDAGESLRSSITDVPPVKPVSAPVPAALPTPDAEAAGSGPSLQKSVPAADVDRAAVDRAAVDRTPADPDHTPARGHRAVTDWDAT